MYTTYSHALTKTNKSGILGLISIYGLMIAGAYILSASIFPEVVESDKIFGYALSKEETFNRILFIHQLAGILFIALAHLVSRIKNVSMSNGNIVLAALLILNIYCFAIGINIPLLHTTKFWIIKEHLSLMQVLQSLELKGEMRIYWIMLLFTFVVPVFKLIAMTYDIFISKADGRKNFLFSLLSKWAMLDVLVVGIIVSTMKSGSGFAEMTTGYGLSFFITAVMLSLVISARLPYTKNN